MNTNTLIKISVQGNFHQGNQALFGASCGKQCSYMALFSICWTKIRKVNIWKDADLDDILHNGDRVFRITNIDRALYVEELPLEISVDNSKFNFEIISIEDGLPSAFTNGDAFLNKDLFNSENVAGVILFIKDVCVSILKGISRNKIVYIFDSHSRDSEGKYQKGKNPCCYHFHALKLLKIIFTRFMVHMLSNWFILGSLWHNEI